MWAWALTEAKAFAPLPLLLPKAYESTSLVRGKGWIHASRNWKHCPGFCCPSSISPSSRGWRGLSSWVPHSAEGISMCQDTPLGPLVLKWPEDGAPHTCFAEKRAGLRGQQPLPQVIQPSTREAGDSQVHVILTCRGFNKSGQEAEEWRKTR